MFKVYRVIVDWLLGQNQYYDTFQNGISIVWHQTSNPREFVIQEEGLV